MGLRDPTPQRQGPSKAGARSAERGPWSTVTFLLSSSPSSSSLAPQIHKEYQAATPCCVNFLLSKARYLKFLPFLTSLPFHLHIKECRAWNLLGKEPQAWSSWGKEPLGWSSLENAHQEWSSSGRGRLGWSSWEKDQWIASPSIAATLFYQRCWG